MKHELFSDLRQSLMDELDLSRELADEEVLEVIDRVIVGSERLQYAPLEDKILLRQELFCSVRRLDVLQELLEDNTVTEIMEIGRAHV